MYHKSHPNPDPHVPLVLFASADWCHPQVAGAESTVGVLMGAWLVVGVATVLCPTGWVSDGLDGHVRRMLGESPKICEVYGHNGSTGLGNRCDEGVDGRSCVCSGS
jgi:hypothetical protein